MTVNLTEWDNVSQFVDPQTGALSIRGQVWLQTILEQINANFGALEAADAALAAADAANLTATNAQAAADAAQTAADNAQSAVDSATADSALASSGVIGCAIVGNDAGLTASVSVSSHTRVYGDGSTVAVNGGGIGGLDFGMLYYIYYVDPTRAGGAVTYVASEDPADAIQAGNVHSVGFVTTPADGSPDTDGSPNPAPGNVT